MGRALNWYSHYEKNMEISQKLKIEAAHDPTILLVDRYPKAAKTMTRADTCPH